MNPTNSQNKILFVTISIILFALGGLGGYWWAGQKIREVTVSDGKTDNQSSTPEEEPNERKVLYWYDPMVPTQKFDKPGKSPFMDMQLVPRYAEEGNDDTQVIGISTQASQNLGLRLAQVGRIQLASNLEAIGTIQFNERDISIIQARTSGFVERVYDLAAGDVVTANSPIVDVLNPEWAAAQQEYLAVRMMGDAALTEAVHTRLTLLGMSASLIQRVTKSGQPIPVITITAPNSGVISELMVRQGMALSPGMTLARINGLKTVWLELAVPEIQASLLSIGQQMKAKLPALPGMVFMGEVTAILPEANRDTRTLRVRVELPNPENRLHPGMLAQASLQGSEQEILAVPAEAVIRTGKRNLVYLATDAGKFQPVHVELGVERDGKLEIRSGLEAGQKIVVSGQFLLDSEASMRGILPPASNLDDGDNVDDLDATHHHDHHDGMQP